ncbi:MAG: type II toxin-antitoxin system VapC family toxin [Phycisphaerae bacterium]
MIACIDTMVLVWWIREECSAGQQEMVKRAQWLMESFDEEQTSVIISTITEAEFLRGSSEQERRAQSRILHETFLVKPFDSIAANLIGTHFPRNWRPDDYQGRRTAMKADMLIVATAVAAGADVLYSHDANCRKLAESAGLQARDLPTMPNHLFDYDSEPDDEAE